jgi:hypothetical protein
MAFGIGEGDDENFVVVDIAGYGGVSSSISIDNIFAKTYDNLRPQDFIGVYAASE